MTGKAKKQERVTVENTDLANGPKGAVAHPLEKDVHAWLAKGWRRVKPAAQSLAKVTTGKE